MKNMRCFLGGLILVIFLLSFAVCFAEEDIEEVDFPVEDLIKVGIIEEEAEGVSYITPEEIAVEDEVEEEEVAPETVEGEVILIPIQEIEEEETEEVKGFDFIEWLKKILGIKEVEEEVSYITPEELAVEEEVEEEIVEEEVIEGEVEEEVSEEERAKVIIVKETDLVSLVPKAYDPDEDVLKYTFTTPLDDNGNWQTTYGDAGEYTVTVTVSDGELSSSKEVLIIVNKKEEAPTIDSFIPESTAVEADENSAVELKVTASDLNKDELTYSWKLDGEEVSTSNEYVYKTTFNDAGSHTIKLIVSDGKLEASKLWSIEVKDVNRLPVLSKIADIKVKETETVKITPRATDLDGDEIKYKISDPVGDDGVWKTTYDDAGEYKVKVTASDGTDSVYQDVNIIVENVNRPPVIRDIIQR